jgi:hypothetical protein
MQIAAAREAIGDSDFFLVARTDARGISAKYGLEEAIKRANLYAEAGADATFVEAPRGEEELRLVGRETKVRRRRRRPREGVRRAGVGGRLGVNPRGDEGGPGAHCRPCCRVRPMPYHQVPYKASAAPMYPAPRSSSR